MDYAKHKSVTDKSHEVSDVVHKHLNALYEEIEAGNFCEVCLIEALITSGIASVLGNTRDVRMSEDFTAHCFRVALDAYIKGAYTAYETKAKQQEKKTH